MTYEPRWYLSSGGADSQGPWTSDEVVRRIVERRVGRGTFVCAEGSGDWVDVADIFCFSAALTATEQDDWSLGGDPTEVPVDLVRPRGERGQVHHRDRRPGWHRDPAAGGVTRTAVPHSSRERGAAMRHLLFDASNPQPVLEARAAMEKKRIQPTPEPEGGRAHSRRPS